MSLSFRSAALVFGLAALWSASPATAETSTPSAQSVSESHYAEVESFLLSVLGQEKQERRATAEVIVEASSASVQQNPGNVSAHLTYVAALGTLARTLDPSESIKGRYGSKSRDAVQALQQVAPDDPVAGALAGVWHLEVARRGGFAGSFLLGASPQEGKALLDEALQADAANPMLPFAYAVALSAQDPKSNKSKILDLLGQCQSRASLKPSALSDLIGQNAEHLAALLGSDQHTEARTFAENVM